VDRQTRKEIQVWLLDKVREFLRERNDALARDRTGAPADLELQAATTILLIEAAYGDTEYVWLEHRAIVRGLEREFGLGRGEIQALLGRADEIRPPVVKLADVTDVIRDRYTAEQRREVVRLLWSVIEADGSVEEWEELFADHVAQAVGLGAAEARAARRPAAG
jgi:uncharacterized tellurite resistance protein B-like protein